MGVYGLGVQVLTQMSISFPQGQNSTSYLASDNLINLRNDLEIIMNSKVHCQRIRSTVTADVNLKGILVVEPGTSSLLQVYSPRKVPPVMRALVFCVMLP